jgi:hypothetical protein
MADRKQEQQDQIARAAAEARGEAMPEAAATPQGVEVRIRAANDRQPHYAYEFGKAHGFSADYAFNAENNFTAHLSPEDAEELRARNDPRFTIKGGE